MPKSKTPHYGRLGHDVDASDVRDLLTELREAVDRMEDMLENPLTYEETWEHLRWMKEHAQVMMACSMLRPIFISHLIGRLREEGFPLTVIAEKAGASKQWINHMLYTGTAGRDTKVPRTRRKRAVVKGAE